MQYSSRELTCEYVHESFPLLYFIFFCEFILLKLFISTNLSRQYIIESDLRKNFSLTILWMQVRFDLSLARYLKRILVSQLEKFMRTFRSKFFLKKLQCWVGFHFCY